MSQPKNEQPIHSALELNNLSCTLLPGKFRNGQAVPALYNTVYHDWVQVWSEVLSKMGNPGALNLDQFLSQDIIIALHLKDQLAGVVTSNFFNLSSHATFDHPYLHSFPEALIEDFKTEGKGILMTGEYFTVCTPFRKKNLGSFVAELLVGLLLKILLHVDAKATLSTTILETKSHEIGKAFGYKIVGEKKKYGLNCMLLVNTKKQYQEHSNPQVNLMVQRLWNQRIDLTGITTQSAHEVFQKAS